MHDYEIAPVPALGRSDFSRPWLSVILPIYRGEAWLSRTLGSIAQQADPGVEVIVIDSSPDTGSIAIVRGFADRLRLRIVDPKGIDGCSPKMNLGVEQAAAEHVTWLCQDDLWLPNRIAAVCGWISEAPHVDLHLAPTAIIDRDDRRLGTWRCPLAERAGALDRTSLLERLLVQNFIAVPSPIIRRDAWMACGGLDLSLWYTGDWDLWLKLVRRGEVRYHDQVTSGFRIHNASATSTGSRDHADFTAQQIAVLERHITALPVSRQAGVRRLSRASAAINTALAKTINGDARSIVTALVMLVGLGPIGMFRYLHRSRLVERTLPRIRARLAGAL